MPRLRLLLLPLLLISVLVISQSCESGPTVDSSGNPLTGNVDSDADLIKGQTEIEDHINQGLGPFLAVSWRYKLNNRGMVQAWLNRKEVIYEDGGQVVRWIDRVSGKSPGNSGYGDLTPNRNRGEDRINRSVKLRPARSENYIHVICNDGTYLRYDSYGNLEGIARVSFGAQNEPAAIDSHVLVAGTDRFFYAWDPDTNTYEERIRLDFAPENRAVVAGTSRVFFSNEDSVRCLSLDRSGFFSEIWARKSFGKVKAPLVVNSALDQLYVATENDGVVTCYSTLNGEYEWDCSTECEIRQGLVVDNRYLKDRLYVITENGLKENGLWCIRTDDSAAKGGNEGAKLWVFEGANKILALGAKHIYVRTGEEGAYKIAVVRTSDGKLEKTYNVHPKVTYFFTNQWGPEVILGTNFNGRTPMFWAATESEYTE